MGQAKNRGTREQRVIAAIMRGTRDSEFTVTGRIPSQPVVQRITSNVPNHEEQPKATPVANLDYAKVEERVLAYGYDEQKGLRNGSAD